MAARAFNRVAWPAFGVLVVTGVWNVLAEREHISGRYETTLVVKICLVAASGLSAALHSRSRSRAGLPYSEHWVEPQRSALCSSGSCSPSDRRAAVRFDCSGGTPVAPGPDDRVLEPVRCTPGVHTRRTYHCVPPVETSCGCGSARVDDDGAFRAPAIPYPPAVWEACVSGAVVGCRSARRTVRVCRCGFSRVVVRSASAQSSSVRVR